MTSRGVSKNKSFWQLLLLALVLAFTANSTWAQDDAEVDDEDGVRLDRVVVTGSRIKRSQLEGAAPIIIIDQQEMSERGYTTVFEALADLPINNGFKFESSETTNGFSPDVQTVNLRGFGVGATLTLINGRRLANYPVAYQSNSSVFSYGSIPIAAIERIEILTTGASAIYGSDAVAGVINIILRSDIDETTVNALWGTPTETKSTRGDLRVQLLNGKTFDRGSYTLTLEYLDRSAIRGRDLDQYDNHQDDYPYGQGFHDRSILLLDRWTGYFVGGEAYIDPGAEACQQTGRIRSYRPGAGYFCGDEDSGSPTTNFQNEVESFSAYFNGKLEIGDGGTELFTDLLYYTGESVSYENGVGFMSEEIFDYTRLDPLFGYYAQWDLAQRIFSRADTGLDTNSYYDNEAWTISAGVRGIFRDLHDWELSYNHSQATYDSTSLAYKSREVIDTFLGQYTGPGFAFGNPTWTGGTLGEDIGFPIGIPEVLYGPINDSVLNTIGTQTYGNKSKDDFAQFNMTGDLFEMSAGPLSYAFVTEYEKESIKYIPDELITQGPPTTDSEGNPITQTLNWTGWYNLTGYTGDGDRSRWAVGGELRIPLHETFTLNLAARWDDYDSTSTSFGGNLTPSASLEWRPRDNFLVRAGYTESFRAPDMAQVFVNSGSFNTAFDYVSCYDRYVFNNDTDDGFDTDDCDTNSIYTQRVGAQQIGLDPLDAEKGDTWWLGFAWDATDNLSLRVDYTNISLDQRTITQRTQGLLNDDFECNVTGELTGGDCDIVDSQIERITDPVTGIRSINNFYRTSINQYEETASYIDVRLVYLLNTEAGQFRFQGDYNNTLSHETQTTPTSEPFDNQNDPRNFGGDDFHSSFVGSLTWSFRDFSTTLTGIYRGRTTVYECFNNDGGCTGNITGENYYETSNYRIDNYVTWNWTAAYNFTDSFMTRFRVVNLFDEKPPWDDTHLPFYNFGWYNTYTYPGAGIGRYAALEMEYTWQ